MSFENYKSGKIEAESVEEHEKMIERRLGEVQLDYADDQIAENRSLKLSDFIIIKTSLISRLKNCYNHLANEQKKKFDEKEFITQVTPILDKIDTIYEQKNESWKNEILKGLLKTENILRKK